MPSPPESHRVPQSPAPLGLNGVAEALLDLCRRDSALAAGPGWRPLDSSGGVPALLELANQHGVLGLVLSRLRGAGRLAELPQPAAADALQSLRTLQRQAALWDLEREFVLSLLAERGIPALLLKGAALRLTAYRDSVERPFGDLDVLVPKDNVTAAIETLIDGGYQGETEARAKVYREHHHHLILRKELGFIVEVHWALEPVQSAFLLDPEAFRQEARNVRTASGLAVQVPSSEHFLLHLSAQNLEDGFSRLGRIVDLDRVVASEPALDWSRVAAEALRMRVNHILALSLRLAELLLGTRVPDRLPELLELSPAARVHLALLDPVGLLLEQRARRRDSLHRLLRLWTTPNRSSRWRLLRAMHWGEQDPITRLLQPERDRARGWRSQLATFKLALYQGWLYLSAIGARVRGLRRVHLFWSSRLTSGLASWHGA